MEKKKIKISGILADKKVLHCGCLMEKFKSGEITGWSLYKHCSMHTPNYDKKAEKSVRLKNKKTGRGYTKSPKRRR